jgi:uncharacterized surface protein with fasciclin (FAS1) repeats
MFQFHSALALAFLGTVAPPAMAQEFRLDFKDGIGSWSTVLDGVMGGLSTGRVSQPEAGILRFTGELSLENNGGFSQMRTGSEGLVLEVKGDGRTYTFDVRVSNVRMMAGAFQQKFDTKAGQWTEVRLPFGEFGLNVFGRSVPNPPALDPAKIESIGVTLSDKKAGSFVLDVRSIRTYSARDAATASTKGSGRDLASVAKSAGLNTLLAAVGKAGLALPNEPVTIFAPTDAAFAALPKGTLEKLLRPESRTTLRTILLQHVVAGTQGSADVLNQRALKTLAEQQLAVDFAKQTIGGANLVATDVPFDGGIVHVVDKVLLPETKSIADIATASDQLKTLVAALQAAGLVPQFGAENGPWTVFAPVDSAFAKLPKSTLESLLKPENRNQLTSILGLHVVPGRIAARELLQKQKLITLLSAPIEAKLVDGKLTVGGAGIVAADIQAANGIVHLVDKVITEPAGGNRPVAASRAGSASDSDMRAELRAIYELAIERGVPLFNRGEVEACAAIYEIATQSMLRLGQGRLDAELLSALRTDCENASAIEDARPRAWAFRRALDEAYRSAAAEPEVEQPRQIGLRPRR